MMTYPRAVLLAYTLALLLALLLAYDVAHAEGLYLDLAGGLSVLNPTITQEDGVWHQQAYPHNFDTMAPAFKVGLSYAFTPQWSVQSHWLYLGTARVSAKHVDDRDYDAKAHVCTGAHSGPSACANPSYLNARDTYQGADLTVTRTFTAGPIQPFIKAGVAVLYHHFRVETDAGAKFSLFGWIPASEVGAGVRHGPFYVEVDYFKGLGGANGGCLSGPCGYPVSKEQVVMWFGVTIPLGR